MLNAILLWLAKQAAEYAVSYIAKKLGYDKAAEHVGDILNKHAPLSPPSLPSPKAQQGPIEGHFGG